MADKPLDNQRDPLDGIDLPPLKYTPEEAGSELKGFDLPSLTPREKPLPKHPLPEPDADEYSGKLRAEKLMEDSGFDPETIGRSLNPEPLVPDSTPIRRNYALTYDDSAVSGEAYATHTLAGQLEAQGAPVPRSSYDQIQSLLMRTSMDGVEGLAASRGWWLNAKRSFARAATPVIQLAMTDFSIGMGLLDTFSWGAKKLKIGLSPATDRAEMEQLLLPKIEVAGKTYTNSATAALSFHRDRWWGGLQVAAGLGLKLASLTPGPGRADTMAMGDRLYKEGVMDWAQANAEAPQLLSALGQHESWTEVVTRHYDANDLDADQYYRWLEESGWKGEIMMWNTAVADAVAEMVMDPFFWVGNGAQKVVPGLRRAAAAAFPGKAAEIAKDVARATQTFEDAVDAVRAAETNLARVEQRVLGRAVTRDGRLASTPAEREAAALRGEVLPELQGSDAQISMDGARELLQARRQLANERQFMSEFQGPGEYSDFVPRPPRRNPAYEPETSEVIEYLEVHPGMDGDLFAPVWVKRQETVPRRIWDLSEEMRLRRHAEIERDADHIIIWDDLPSESPLKQQRVLFGADDAEQAGDAINLAVRTGGMGIEDATLTPTAVEYSAIPNQGKVPIRNWRAIDEANAATKAEREFLGEPVKDAAGTIIGYKGGTASGQYSLEMSTKRTLSRQLDIANKNLGYARRIGDKEKIKLYEAEAKRIKNFRDKLDTEELVKADKDFVDWLPEHSDGIMGDPGKFNAWLGVAGDRAMRSLYPGGLHINALWNTKAGQVFAPWREPQRYYSHHSPATWERVHGGMLNYERGTRAWAEEMLQGGLESGLIKERGWFNPKQHFSPYDIDTAKNETLFDLLDAAPNSEAWNEAAKKADEPLLALHWKIRERLDLAADQQGIKLGDEDGYITGYIRHIFTKDQFHGGARPPEYLGMPRNAEVFAGHLLHRNGEAGFPRDAWSALEIYGRAMNRRMHVQPVYDEIQVAAQEIAKRTGNRFHIDYANDLIGEMQGRPAFIGAKVDAWLGGAINKDGGEVWKPGSIDRALVGLSGAWWSGMLPGNPRYPLMQMTTGVATTSGRFGLFRTIRGLTTQATREGQAASRAAGTYEQFEKVFESDFMRQFSEFMTKRGFSIGPMGIQTTATTEEMIRGATFHAAMEMHMAKLGISSWAELRASGYQSRVVYEGLRSSLEVNHMFGMLGRSPMMTQTFGKGPAVTATQFLSFIPKQSEELLAQFNRNPGNLAMYMAMSGWMSRMAAEELGMDLTDYVGLGYLPDTPSDLTSPGVDTIIAGMDWLSALDSGDLEGQAKALEDFLGSLDSMIPAIVAWKTGSKSAEQLTTGRSYNTRGEFDRPNEFGGFVLDGQIPLNAEGNVDVGAALDEFGRGFGPQKTGDLTPNAAPGVGGDLYPMLTGARPIRDAMFRRAKDATIKDARDFRFEAQSAVVSLWQALQKGDTEAAQEFENLLVNKYKIALSATNQLEKMALAQELSWTLRALSDADEQTLVRIVNEIRTNGISLGN